MERLTAKDRRQSRVAQHLIVKTKLEDKLFNVSTIRASNEIKFPKRNCT